MSKVKVVFSTPPRIRSHLASRGHEQELNGTPEIVALLTVLGNHGSAGAASTLPYQLKGPVRLIKLVQTEPNNAVHVVSFLESGSGILELASLLASLAVHAVELGKRHPAHELACLGEVLLLDVNFGSLLVLIPELVQARGLHSRRGTDRQDRGALPAKLLVIAAWGMDWVGGLLR